MADRGKTVIWASSYDRGLECLLNMWPSIRQAVPNASLNIFYGWNSFDAVHRQNPEQMKWKWNIIRMLHDQKANGVTEHGRISHEELATQFKAHKVWAYPTEFDEIHCITALKAQEAGCIPVTTACYALETTIADHTFSVPCTDIYSNEEKQQEFIDMVVKALNSDHQVKPVEGVSWKDVAKVWHASVS